MTEARLAQGLARRLLLPRPMKWIARLSLLLAMIGLLAPTDLLAQTTGRLALGLGVSVARSSDPETRGSTGLGFFYRFGQATEGWGWRSGLGWYSAELDRQLGSELQEFGHLRIRPLLAGYGYTHAIGRSSISMNLMGGYAFTSFSRRDTFDAAYLAARGVEVTKTSSSNAFVLRPEASIWHDINKKFGLNVSGGYIIARPEVAVTSSLGEERRRVRADMFTIRAGLTYSVF